MGNVFTLESSCLKGRKGARESSDIPPGSRCPRLWSPLPYKREHCGEACNQGAPSLQHLCVSAVASNFSELCSGVRRRLPTDLVQLVYDEITRRGELQLHLLDSEEIYLDSLVLDGYATATNEWVVCLKRSSPHLRSLDLSRCSQVCC